MLDYSWRGALPTVTVSSFNVSKCLKSLRWSLPAHEPETPAAWQAELVLALTVAAEADGVTEADLSPVTNEARWAPGVARVVVTGTDWQLVFRVESWRYDPETKTGTGQLAQQIELYDKPLPQLSPEIVYPEPVSNTKTIVERLLGSVKSLVTQPFDVGPVNLTEHKFYGMRSTRNPLSEVQTFAKADYAWLMQRLSDEQVQVQPVRYRQLPVAFARALQDAEVQPNLDTAGRVASTRLIAHGSAEVPDACGDDAPDIVNEQGQPKQQVTEQREALGVVFPDVAPNASLIISQRKTVKYYYLTDTLRESFADVPVFPRRTPPYAVNESTGLYATEVIIEEPLGKVIANQGTNSQLIISNRTVETAEFKATWKPYSVMFPAETVVRTDLVLSDLEQLRTQFVPRTGFATARLPNGSHACLDIAQPEKPQAVQLKLTTASFRAQAILDLAYTPALDYPLVYDMGFCPSQGSAQTVATALAVRERALDQADSVRLPLPVEWLRAGCPPFARAVVGAKRYFIDEPAAELSIADDGRVTASLDFTGALLDFVQPLQKTLPTVTPLTWPSVFYGMAEAPLSYQLGSGTTISGGPPWLTVTPAGELVATQPVAGSFAVTLANGTTTSPATVVIASAAQTADYARLAARPELNVAFSLRTVAEIAETPAAAIAYSLRLIAQTLARPRATVQFSTRAVASLPQAVDKRSTVQFSTRATAMPVNPDEDAATIEFTARPVVQQVRQYTLTFTSPGETTPSYPATVANLIDNDYDSGALLANDGFTRPEIVFDLGSAQTVSEIKLGSGFVGGFPAVPSGSTLAYSNDGVSWTVASTVPSMGTYQEATIPISPVIGARRYWRLQPPSFTFLGVVEAKFLA